MKRLMAWSPWPMIGWLLLVAAVLVAIVTGCTTKTQAAAPKRFEVVYEQPSPSIRVIKDMRTGACFIQVSPGASGTGLAEAPNEVCEVKEP